MAGESPDKTEQRKSSGTAEEERDPRFAVFRDPGADTDADADAGTDARTGPGADSGATSDTATAVFRPRLPEDAARREPEAGSDDPSESDVEPESDAAGPGTEPESAPVTASAASGDADAPSKGAGAAEGRSGPDADVEASEAEEADAPEAGKSETAGDGDGRLRAAVAAWVDAAAEDTPKAEDAEEAEDADPEPEPAAKAEPKPEPEPGPDEEPDAEAKAELKTDEESKAEQDDEPKADSEQEKAADAEPATASDSEPDKAPAAEAEAEPATASDSEPAADSEPTPDDASDLRGIDQPTAIFKAVKPADRVDQATTALKLPPREDKPKSEPKNTPRDEPKGGAESKPGAKPESEAERTSTFVPLRSDDVRTAPAPRKPEPESDSDAESAAGPEAPARTPEAGSPVSPAAAAPSWAAAERTRQQPLPPKPPLDLLAELTNTPPPPETPVRTAVRRVKIWTPLVLLLLIVFAIVQVMRPLPEPSLELTAKPTYTFEGGGTELSWPGQGQSAVMVDGVGSLGSEGAQKPAPIASVAKVMTAYVILQGHPLKGDEEGEKITVDQKAEDESKRPDESTAPLTKGQELTQRQLLQLLMIPSGNNAARLLARWDAGSEDKFIDKMNDAAKDLGMTGSTYTDPSGLEKTTVSTATDQLKLAQAVMRNDVFRKIVDMPEVEIEGIDGKIYNNNNLLLQPGVSGIKTGSSTPAGGNLLWSANTKVDGKVLWIYGAVMGQQAGTGRVYDSLELSLQNSLKLIKDAQEAATSATVVKKGDVVGYVDNGFGGQAPVVATKNLKAVGWSGLEVELKVTDNGKGIDQAAKAGTEVGSVTVGTGTGKVTAPVVLQSDLPEAAFGDKMTRIG
ncbi:serine hydrolase [Streptomyces rubiginosohelvolus]|uniref:D-alanyl-D-alanine carboxypeptidase n=1 Tax=Streptomyces rubiginosohelvolus TaxID=67362 RepID=A0ABQ3C3M6_9ACTN|nr:MULTISPECIES: serine hydrolase [Streptomyces]GGS10195.1 D-alanyl-D-alanine carboxypeptidase [Streptomyces rubiginosohelvolus]GGZ66327.1 D-alanyl-D-alanine carboxypeptidase [Streptomyces pluricolorescens]